MLDSPLNPCLYRTAEFETFETEFHFHHKAAKDKFRMNMMKDDEGVEEN